MGQKGLEQALCIERYDRMRQAKGYMRVHQEDVCQSLSVPPSRKYESDGGPGAIEIASLLRQALPSSIAEAAVWQFLDGLIWNWIIGGTDAHAKNYSVLLSGDDVRLAPLYDLASALPYDGSDELKLKLAMKLGDEYRLKAHRPSTWPRMADALGLDQDAVVARVATMLGNAVDSLSSVAKHDAVRSLRSRLPTRLVDAVAQRVERCRRQLP